MMLLRLQPHKRVDNAVGAVEQQRERLSSGVEQPRLLLADFANRREHHTPPPRECVHVGRQ
jgi:hypothetical protein